MAVSRPLRHLLRIRELEEGQSRGALETAAHELRRLETALAAARERGRRARLLILESARTGALADRLAGINDTRTSMQGVEVLTHRIRSVEQEVAALRQRFLHKRMERRQAETLLQQREVRESAEQARRLQQTLDEWHRSLGTRASKERSEGQPDKE